MLLGVNYLLDTIHPSVILYSVPNQPTRLLTVWIITVPEKRGRLSYKSKSASLLLTTYG